jgi:hypothetical protein
MTVRRQTPGWNPRSIPAVWRRVKDRRLGGYAGSTVQRIYLDLNKWVDLGRGDQRRSARQAFQAIATMICAAVEQGQASFPLSMGHYFETWKKRSAEQRLQLARTMAAISRNHAIAPHAQLLPDEIDRALQRRFGRPASLRPLRPSGWGLRHSSGDLAPVPSQTMRAIVLETNPSLSEKIWPMCLTA